MTDKKKEELTKHLEQIVQIASELPAGRYRMIYNKCRIIKLTLRKIKDNSKQITL